MMSKIGGWTKKKQKPKGKIDVVEVSWSVSFYPPIMDDPRSQRSYKASGRPCFTKVIPLFFEMLTIQCLFHYRNQFNYTGLTQHFWSGRVSMMDLVGSSWVRELCLILVPKHIFEHFRIQPPIGFSIRSSRTWPRSRISKILIYEGLALQNKKPCWKFHFLKIFLFAFTFNTVFTKNSFWWFFEGHPNRTSWFFYFHVPETWRIPTCHLRRTGTN